MWGVSNIGRTNSDAYRLYLQRNSAGRKAESESDGDADDAAGSGVSSANGSASSGQNDLISQIQASIQQALDSSSSSSNSSDLINKISSSIEKTLKDNGIHPERPTEQMQSSEGRPSGGPRGPMRPGMGPPPPPPPTDGAAASGNAFGSSSSLSNDDDSSNASLNQLIAMLKQMFSDGTAAGTGSDQLAGLVINTQA